MRYYDEYDDKELDKEVRKKLKGVNREANVIHAKLETESSPAHFGLCSTCNNFHGATSKFGRVFARCEDMGIKLNQTDPIIECTYYDQRGVLDLKDMKEMAVMIEVEKKTIGFIKEDDK